MSDSTACGSCLCEGFTFEVQGQPESIFWCYCSHCRKNAGGPGQISAKFSKDQVSITKGAQLVKSYRVTDTLSKFDKEKVFCETCGCTLWTIPLKHNGEKLIVRTSLIDDGLRTFQPQTEFFASQKPEFNKAIKAFETMPGY